MELASDKDTMRELDLLLKLQTLPLTKAKGVPLSELEIKSCSESYLHY